MDNPRVYIAIATFYPVPGGAETAALAQGQKLRERGYEATIITFRLDRRWQPYEEMEGVPVLRIAGTLLGDRDGLPKIIRKITYLMALIVMGWTLWRHRRRYDLLHVYQLNLLALPTALACLITGKPMVIAVRSTGLEDPAKPSSKSHNVSLIAGPLDATAPWLRVRETDRASGDLADLERLGKPTVQFTRSLLCHIQAVVVVLSSRMRNYLAAYNFHLLDVRLIPNGVDLARFEMAGNNIPTDKSSQVVICVSRLSYKKGTDVLLQAWNLVHKDFPLARLIIVGNGLIQEQLECMAKELGIAESVSFEGLRDDIPVQLRKGVLAVLPSRTEGMPMALLEAMACSLPCVATRVSGSEDIVEHEVNGLLVESEDYQAMAQAMGSLLRDQSLILQYGQAARTTVETNYSLEHITDIYLELYQSMLNKQGSTNRKRNLSVFFGPLKGNE